MKKKKNGRCHHDNHHMILRQPRQTTYPRRHQHYTGIYIFRFKTRHNKTLTTGSSPPLPQTLNPLLVSHRFIANCE